MEKKFLLDILEYTFEYFQKNKIIEHFNLWLKEKIVNESINFQSDESNNFKINDTLIADLSKANLFFYNSLISEYFKNKDNDFDNWYKKIKNGMWYL